MPLRIIARVFIHGILRKHSLCKAHKLLTADSSLNTPPLAIVPSRVLRVNGEHVASAPKPLFRKGTPRKPRRYPRLTSPRCVSHHGGIQQNRVAAEPVTTFKLVKHVLTPKSFSASVSNSTSRHGRPVADGGLTVSR